MLTESARQELLSDLLDAARSLVGRAERALAESCPESSLPCLREGSTRLAEFMLFEAHGRRVKRMQLQQAIRTSDLPADFRQSFAEIHGFDRIDDHWLAGTLETLRAYLADLGSAGC